jgi:Transposase zinc-binding domain
MVEVADIFRLHGPDYRAKFADRMLPSHRRAMEDICRCRTEALGGQVYYCANCQDYRYSYHSCIMGSNFLWRVGCHKCLIPLAGQVS